MPSWHVFAMAAALAGRPVLEAVSDQPARVKALAVATDEGVAVVLVNLTGETVEAKLEGVNGATGWVLDEDTFAAACREAQPLEAQPLTMPLTLQPYAVARLDVARPS